MEEYENDYPLFKLFNIRNKFKKWSKNTSSYVLLGLKMKKERGETE